MQCLNLLTQSKIVAHKILKKKIRLNIPCKKKKKNKKKKEKNKKQKKQQKKNNKQTKKQQQQQQKKQDVICCIWFVTGVLINVWIAS